MRSLLVVLALLPTLAFAQATGALLERKDGTDIKASIEGLLVGYGQASVSAASLARVGGDAVTAVENVRDFAIAFKGDTPLSKKVFGISITPARTSLARPGMSLETYVGKKKPDGTRENNWGWRLLGSTTFSYAQGDSPLGGLDFQRRSLAMETSLFLDPNDDPLVAYADEECVRRALDTTPSRTPPQPTPSGPVVLQQRDPSAAVKAFKEGCVDRTLAKLEERWNRTRVSASLATGWIRRADGTGDQTRLGQMLALGIVWGFDLPMKEQPLPGMLRDSAALSLSVRTNRDEPVLSSLTTGPVVFANSTLAAMRLTAGSGTFRALVEVSNARSRHITTGQSTFRRALGVDYRVSEGVWLNIRSGKQRKLDGSGDEVGSFLALNYSPRPDLKLAL